MVENPRIVIIGGVAGGMSAATRLRRLMEHASITVIERSANVSYANCGLPYHVGGIIPERDSLLLQTPESLHRRFNLDVRISHEASNINRDSKTLDVLNLLTGESETLAWDYLILSPGARPVLPPIEGIERAYTLRTVEDADTLIAASADAKRVVVMGGGFIGLELAENFRHRGLSVDLVEAAPQLMAPIDIEMAHYVHEHMAENGVNVHLDIRVTAIGEHSVTLDNGDVIETDLVVSAIGVRPDSSIADAAGLETNEVGAIKVDALQRTNDPAIFAIGDATETRNANGDAAFIPLAGPANRQGRLVADVIAGNTVRVPNSLGTSILGVFGLQVAATGRNERVLRAQGQEVRVIHTHPLNHAGYHPGAKTLRLKLIVDPATDDILGAQAIGAEGADKRIDVIATAMRGGLKASDLIDLDLSYAPQFGSAKDPVNMLGYINANQHTGGSTTVQWHEVDELVASGTQLIDVRTPAEFAANSIPGAINIELDTLRDHIDEISQGAIVHCAVGLRGYLATRVLAGYGIESSNLDGGISTWTAGISTKTPVAANA